MHSLDAASFSGCDCEASREIHNAVEGREKRRQQGIQGEEEEEVEEQGKEPSTDIYTRQERE